jgi:hypothetical protein
MFKFTCATCGEVHEGIPSFGWDAPPHYYDIPENERAERCELTSDTCVINNEWFFVCGCLELPILGADLPFVWGVWLSLSEKNFLRYLELYEVKFRDDEPPFFGWLMTTPSGYPDDEILKTNVHLRNDGTRPYIELQPTEHPLSIEQRDGITQERLIEICQMILH